WSSFSGRCRKGSMDARKLETSSNSTLMRLRLLIRNEPWAWIDIISLRGVKHWGVLVDEILPRHEVIRAQSFTHCIPRIEFLAGIPMPVRMQDERKFWVVGANLLPIAQHLQLELVQDESLLRQVIILHKL